MEYKSVFYPSEMDLYDALYANTQKITNNYLLELAKDRGIILSHDDDREYLIRYISLLNHDYFEFKTISDQIARNTRNDKVTSDIINLAITDANIMDICKGVEKQRSAKHERCVTTRIDDDTTRIEVVYNEIDHSKTPMIQKVTSQAVFDIIKTKSGIKIRHTANHKAADIKGDIIDTIKKTIKIDVKPITISFEGIKNTAVRTLFFTKLISSITGYDVENVSKIKLNSKDSISSEELEEVEAMEDDLICFIRKVSYDGNHLLNSPEYKQLEKKGYFITEIRWILIEKGKNPDKVEIEVSFDQPEKGIDYKYTVRGVYRHKKGGYTQLRPARVDEEANIMAKIENASIKIFQDIIKSAATKKGKK